MITVSQKIQNASHKLNADAYVLQSQNGKRKLRHFVPCSKSLVLLECLREKKHLGMAMAIASITVCECHASLSQEDLWSMCFDNAAYMSHHNAQ